jgi:hypothetical protein
MRRAWRQLDYWRFNYAFAMQPFATDKTPDLPTMCRLIRDEFWPERIRVAQLHPGQRGDDGHLLDWRDIDRRSKD